jgi:hypothetical protein
MSRAPVAFTLCVLLCGTAAAQQTGQPGALSSQTQRLQSEILISTLATPDLTREITAENGTLEHVSEVTRGEPVAAVLRTAGCQKDSGACKVNADVVVYRPDGSVFYEAKGLDLPQGRAAVPLKLDAQAPTGVYRVEATIRDLAARRFAKIDRQFGVK